jgi:ATP-dependent phosphofructokinase / diphosphate-dependent phosphofructokinase
MNVGVLTGGGDCPGLNAAIRGVTRRGIGEYNFNIIGIQNGWLGLTNGLVEPLSLHSVSGILPKGGTFLGTARKNPYNKKEDLEKVKENLKRFGIDALVCIGGEDTLGVATKLTADGIVNCIGVPKTIDNDLSGTDYTFGFDTAVSIATDAVDRLHSTAESHHRVMVVEVMGRHAGWIATYSGMAGGADCILIPEKPYHIEEVCDLILARKNRGKTFSIVVTSEGATPAKDKDAMTTQDNELDEFGHVKLGGIGDILGKDIEDRTGIETRVTRLGHIQRGGTPTAFDRILATRCGVKAADMVHEGDFGKMVAIRGTEVVGVPLHEATDVLKTVDMKLFDVASVFFG